MTVKKARSAIYRGAAGKARAEEELARSKERAEARKAMGNQPFRFKVNSGDTTQFIICDDEPEVYRYEHNLQDRQTQRWNIFTGCVKEFDNCPVCEATGRESYYAMYLTVIDLTPFETRDGDTVEFSRKLLVVKPAQQKKFHRLYARAVKDGCTLRGMLVETTRDGDKDASIGNDFELVDYVDEDEMLTYVRTWTDKEKKRHTEKCHEVLDYEALFGELDADKLRAVVGGEPPPGSRQHEERAVGRRGGASRPSAYGRSRNARDAEDDGEDADGEYEEPSRRERMDRGAPPARRGGARRGAGRDTDDAGDDAEGYDEGADGEDTRPTARRGSSRRQERSAPEPRGRAHSRRGRDVDEGDDEDGEDTPPAPRSRPAPGTRRRAEPEEPDDPPPASRRVVSRRPLR